MRNGDYTPSRFEAQQDAGKKYILVIICFPHIFSKAGVLCNDRINSNPENTVGLLTMAGQG